MRAIYLRCLLVLFGLAALALIEIVTIAPRARAAPAMVGAARVPA